MFFREINPAELAIMSLKDSNMPTAMNKHKRLFFFLKKSSADGMISLWIKILFIFAYFENSLLPIQSHELSFLKQHYTLNSII